jgi:hypothetical protein
MHHNNALQHTPESIAGPKIIFWSKSDLAAANAILFFGDAER